MAKVSSGWVSSEFDFVKPAPCHKDSRASHDMRKRKAPRGIQANLGARAWIDKYSPSEKGDLAVHRRKVQQVEDWMKEALSRPRGTGKCPLLLLTGPTGCGKTATARVLASHLALSVQEWRNTTQYVAYRGHHTDQEFVYEEQQMPNFSSFLFRASRYSDLCQEQGSGRLVLVEDLPNLCFRDPAAFQSALRSYANFGRSPTVFILSDCSQREMSSLKLFPKELVQELGIHEISFNPITTLAISSVLLKVLSAEKETGGNEIRSISKPELHSLAEDCRGDVRAAINSLQFAASPTPIRPRKASRKCRSSEVPKRPDFGQEEERGALLLGKDSTLVLFHALGKVLYCKRDENRGEPQLPSHLSKLERRPLVENPEMIVERAAMSRESFNLFLHQNFLEFYQDADLVSDASDYLSTADCLHPTFEDRSGEHEYGSSVGVRGLMFHLGNGTKQVSAVTGGRKWMPLRKPAWYDTSRICQKNLSLSREEFKDSLMRLGQELHVTSIPYMSKMLSSCPSGRRYLIQELTKFSKGTEKRFGFPGEVLHEEEEEENRYVFSRNNCDQLSLSSNEDNVHIDDISD